MNTGHALVKVTIGEYTYGKNNLRVFKWERGNADLYVGKYCSIAADVRIYLGGNHRTDWVTTYPLGEFNRALNITGHPVTKGDVIIGNDVWLGNSCTIMSGVTIGDGAVIGTEAVVAKNIEPYAIAVGNPATVKRLRFNTRIIRDLLSIKWWDWPHEKVVRFAPLLCSTDVNKFIEEALKCQE